MPQNIGTGFIIFGILLFIGVAMTSRMTDNFAKTIMWLQIAAIGLSRLELDGVFTWAFVLYLLTLVCIVVYALVKPDIRVMDRILMSLSASSVLLGNIFKIQHYKGGGILQTIGLLSIVSLFLLIFKGTNKVYNEIGFMVVLAVVSGYGFISHIAGG